jgi:hypothetical protein
MKTEKEILQKITELKWRINEDVKSDLPSINSQVVWSNNIDILEWVLGEL